MSRSGELTGTSQGFPAVPCPRLRHVTEFRRMAVARRMMEATGAIGRS